MALLDEIKALILQTLQLGTEWMLVFGRGWSKQQLRHCLRFVEIFPEWEIVSPLWRQLSWSHFKALICSGSHAPAWESISRYMLAPYASPRGSMGTRKQKEWRNG